MIYYDIQTHFINDNLLSLIDTLKFKKNIVNISFDGSLEEFLSLEKMCSNRNVQCEHSPVITWGGFSITSKMFKALQKALKSQDWEYFVNLSGECTPLKSQEHIFNTLNEFKSKGRLNFFSCFTPLREGNFFAKKSGNSKFQSIKYGRVEFLTTHRLANDIKKGFFDPTKNIMDRIATKFTEIEKNLFKVEPLTIEEIIERVQFLDQNEYKVGRQWVILHRSTVEWLVKSTHVQNLLTFSKHTFISDEFFYPMALASPYNPFNKNNCFDSLRLNGGGVKNINQHNMDEYLSSPYLFGRKLQATENTIFKKL